MVFRNGIVAPSFLSAALAVAITGCAAPAPAPTSPPVAALTPTKAPTATPTKAPLVKLTLTMSSEGWPHLPALLSESLGYFRDENFDLDRVVTGKGDTAAAAVVGGSAQIVSGAATEPINAAAQKGRPLVIVATQTIGTSPNLVIHKEVADRLGITAKSPLMDRIKALKGLTLGISGFGSATDTLMRTILRKGGLDPERDAIIIASGGTEAMIAALKARQIDGFIRSSPTSDVPIAEGWGVMAVALSRNELPELAERHQVGLAMLKDYAEAHPEVGLPAARAITKALKFILANEATAKEATRKLSIFAELDAKLFESMWGYNYPDPFPKDAVTTVKSLETEIEQTNLIAKEPITIDPKTIIFNQYAEQARDQLRDWRP